MYSHAVNMTKLEVIISEESNCTSSSHIWHPVCWWTLIGNRNLWAEDLWARNSHVSRESRVNPALKMKSPRSGLQIKHLLVYDFLYNWNVWSVFSHFKVYLRRMIKDQGNFIVIYITSAWGGAKLCNNHTWRFACIKSFFLMETVSKKSFMSCG